MVIKSQDNRIKTRTAEIVLEEDGIVHVNIFPNIEMIEEDAAENVAAYKIITKGKNCPLFVDITRTLSIDKKARSIVTAIENAPAVALLIGSPLSKVIGNFTLGLGRPTTPYKLFTSEPEALEWLKGFLK